MLMLSAIRTQMEKTSKENPALLEKENIAKVGGMTPQCTCVSAFMHAYIFFTTLLKAEQVISKPQVVQGLLRYFVQCSFALNTDFGMLSALFLER